MMLTTLIGAMTLAALGPNHATHYNAKDQVRSPEIIEIHPGMINTSDTRRGQIRFSNQTRGQVVAESNSDGSIQWSSSDREKLGGQDAPAKIYIQMFDGVFAIDPFSPLPAATDATAPMLFRGTTLETDRTQHGRQQIDRTKELFRKLEQARVNWLRDNGFYGVRVYTNDRAQAQSESQAKANTLPEPAAVFERPADMPRTKSREQVNADEQLDTTQKMTGVVAMLQGDEPVRVSLPHMMASDVVARIDKRNAQHAQADEQAQEVSQADEQPETTQVAIDQ